MNKTLPVCMYIFIIFVEKIMIETWHTIKGFEDYLISDFGFIRSYKFGRLKILIPYINNKYFEIQLSKNGKTKSFTIHSLVAQGFLGHKIGGHDLVVDHIDKDTFNNQVSNLRVITHRENLSRTKRGSSKYTGVYWCKTNRRWRSKIQIKGKRYDLGSFDSEQRAHLAYQRELNQFKKESHAEKSS